MAKVVLTIAADDGMSFEQIMSFKTENHIGIWNGIEECFVLIKKRDIWFEPWLLDKCNDLQELDNIVFEKCDEHITEVFDNSIYEIKLG